VLNGKRVLITQASEFMGPTLAEIFAQLGAEVVLSEGPLVSQDAITDLPVDIDAVVANLAIPAPRSSVLESSADEWREVFAALVDPLPRLVQHLAPAMISRGHGKILVMGSASALRGMKNASTYSAARGAQISFVQAAGVELARKGVQLNIIAQNFVDNPTYFPPDVQANPKFKQRLDNEVPLGRLVAADEDAQFAAFLCSDAANHFVGQVFPVCGGWVQR